MRQGIFGLLDFNSRILRHETNVYGGSAAGFVALPKQIRRNVGLGPSQSGRKRNSLDKERKANGFWIHQIPQRIFSSNQRLLREKNNDRFY
jgi:hypothetical protein